MCTTVVEDLSLASNTYVRWPTTACNWLNRMPPLASLGTFTHDTYIHTYIQIYI